jgi:RNA polymerase sigma factor (sigma-70 family)
MLSLANSDQHGPNDVERLYREVNGSVVGQDRRWLPDGYEDEDLLHDSFVRRLEQGSEAEPIRKPKSYYKRVITHGRIDRLKRKSRNNISLDELTNDDPAKELVDPRRNPEMQAEFNEKIERYRRMLKIACRDLTKRERELLALHLQGFSNKEIANHLGESLKAIRHDINAIMAKIRYRLVRLLENEKLPST